MPGISFDRAAAYYDATRGYGEGSAERIRDAIVAYTGIGQGARVLELGVGTGRIMLPFIRAGYDVTGVDLSQTMMDRLLAQIAGDPGRAGYRVELHQADITALPFGDAAFDLVVAVHVLHLVDDWRAALREARRVLRPGGELRVLEHVLAHEPGPLRSVQRALDATFWPLLAGGCHCARDTVGAVEGAGFGFESLERFTFPAGSRGLDSSVVLGRAR